MFGKKDKSTSEVVIPLTARIETMPGVFYGGADPIIYSSAAKSENTDSAVELPPVPPLAPKKVVPQPVPVIPASTDSKNTLQKPPLPPSKKNRTFLIVVILCFVLLCLAFLVYFVFFSKTPQPLPKPPVIENKVSFVPSPTIPTTTPPITPVLVPSSTPSSTPVVKGGGALSLPKISYTSGLDDDSDSLTNSEEIIFQTDPEVWDTDSDGYYDGREVANLYNPKGIAPQKIIDSGLVREYINSLYQYRFYYPASWRVDAVTNDLKDILLSADTGDYIEIRVFPKENNQTFQDWFTATLPQESFSSLSSLENRFKVPFYKHKNSQAGFFETPSAIYSVVYFYGEEEKNAFPHVMEVVLQSFRPSKGTFELPVQVILPGVRTSSEVMTTTTL